MQARRRCSFFLFFLPALLFVAGCRHTTEVVEAELRNKDRQYREALEDQRSTEARAEALQREIDALRKGSRISPEQAAQSFGLRRIVLGRATGGYDQDAVPGDELLQVIVEPRDLDDHTIKSPGTLQIYTLEIDPQGIKIPLSSWEIPPDKLRQSWKQGLLSTGYTLQLPWKSFPQFENVRVVVRFITPDLRVYEADKDVKVRVVAGASQKRCDPPSDILPSPTPLPMQDIGPTLLPTAKFTQSSYSPQPPPVSGESDWQPLRSPQRAITIGQPEPLDTPASPPPVSSFDGLPRR